MIGKMLWLRIALHWIVYKFSFPEGMQFMRNRHFSWKTHESFPSLLNEITAQSVNQSEFVASAANMNAMQKQL